MIDRLDTGSPIVRAMLALLPHCSPPAILEPHPSSLLPQGCIHLPSMRLILAGATGPVEPTLSEAERIARAADCDMLIVSIRADAAGRALRYDALFIQQDRTEFALDLLFWTLPHRMAALVPVDKRAAAVIIGRSTLIPSDAMPYADAAERVAGIARGASEQRLALWGEP